MPAIPTYDRAFFLAALTRAGARDYRTRLTIGGTCRHPAPTGAEVREKVLPCARLLIMLHGRQRYDVDVAGEHHTLTLRPGDALYWPPHAWTCERWDTPCRFLGVVLRREFLRVILVDFAGGTPPAGATPHAYHTLKPLSGAALATARALDALPAGSGGDSGAHLFSALLGLVHQHVLVDDQAHASATSRSRATWNRVTAAMQEHPDLSPSRAAIARAVGIHPTYLSALCQRHAGRPFSALVGDARLERARDLLRHEPLRPIAEIAAACGYASTSYFIRVFRRVEGLTPGAFRQHTLR